MNPHPVAVGIPQLFKCDSPNLCHTLGAALFLLLWESCCTATRLELYAQQACCARVPSWRSAPKQSMGLARMQRWIVLSPPFSPQSAARDSIR